MLYIFDSKGNNNIYTRASLLLVTNSRPAQEQFCNFSVQTLLTTQVQTDQPNMIRATKNYIQISNIILGFQNVLRLCIFFFIPIFPFGHK